MMMTSGEAVKYKGSIDCANQIIKGEGFMSLMKGAGKSLRIPFIMRFPFFVIFSDGFGVVYINAQMCMSAITEY